MYSDGIVLLCGESVRRVGKIGPQPWVLGGQTWSLCRTVPDDNCWSWTKVSTISTPESMKGTQQELNKSSEFKLWSRLIWIHLAKKSNFEISFVSLEMFFSNVPNALCVKSRVGFHSRVSGKIIFVKNPWKMMNSVNNNRIFCEFGQSS